MLPLATHTLRMSYDQGLTVPSVGHGFDGALYRDALVVAGFLA